MTDFGSRHKLSHQDGGGDEISVSGLSGLLADEQDAGEIKGVEVDGTDIAADKVLAYNETTEKLEYETPTTGGDTYVNRGDPSASDWTEATLTTDANWNNLDCSAIVPANTKAIIFSVLLYDGAAGGQFKVQKKGNTYHCNSLEVSQPVANMVCCGMMVIPCDENRFVEYYATHKAWSIIYLHITGWII